MADYKWEVLKIGPECFITVWAYPSAFGYWFEISIYGQGSMYTDVNQFYVYQRESSGYAWNWNTVWAGCKGELGTHESSERASGEITIPSGITSIAARMFDTDVTNRDNIGIRQYNTIHKITVESGNLHSIGNRAFACSNEVTYQLQGDNGVLYDMVNSDKDYLREIDFTGANITELGIEVFDNRTQLKNLNFGGRINYIGNRAFRNCYNLETINLGMGVGDSGLAFENGTFMNCFSLRDNIYIHSPSWGNTGVNAFKNCYSMSMLTFPYPSNYNTVRPDESCFYRDRTLYNNLLNHYLVRGYNDPYLIPTLKNVIFDSPDPQTRNFVVYLNEQCDSTWPLCKDWSLENIKLLQVNDGREHRRPFVVVNSYVNSNDVPLPITIPLYPTPKADNQKKYMPIKFDDRIWWMRIDKYDDHYDDVIEIYVKDTDSRLGRFSPRSGIPLSRDI